MKELIRRRVRSIKSTLGEAARVHLLDEGFQVRDTSGYTQPAPTKEK